MGVFKAVTQLYLNYTLRQVSQCQHMRDSRNVEVIAIRRDRNEVVEEPDAPSLAVAAGDGMSPTASFKKD